VAVERFLAGTLDFPGISRVVAAAVGRFGDPAGRGDPALEELAALDREVRAWCETARPGVAP
jgi:1-deoxy-D-xylulose 5-phosphate reductoisomerase